MKLVSTNQFQGLDLRHWAMKPHPLETRFRDKSPGSTCRLCCEVNPALWNIALDNIAGSSQAFCATCETCTFNCLWSQHQTPNGLQDNVEECRIDSSVPSTETLSLFLPTFNSPLLPLKKIGCYKRSVSENMSQALVAHKGFERSGKRRMGGRVDSSSREESVQAVCNEARFVPKRLCTLWLSPTSTWALSLAWLRCLGHRKCL